MINVFAPFIETTYGLYTRGDMQNSLSYFSEFQRTLSELYPGEPDTQPSPCNPDVRPSITQKSHDNPGRI